MLYVYCACVGHNRRSNIKIKSCILAMLITVLMFHNIRSTMRVRLAYFPSRSSHGGGVVGWTRGEESTKRILLLECTREQPVATVYFIQRDSSHVLYAPSSPQWVAGGSSYIVGRGESGCREIWS